MEESEGWSMDNYYQTLRRQKHIWQIAFVVLAIAVFVLAFYLYKDKASVQLKLKPYLSVEKECGSHVDRFLKTNTVHNSPIEIQEMSRSVNGGR